MATARRVVLDGIRDLFPGYFALVMATGALGVATALHGVPGIPELLLGLNALAYVGLAGLLSTRFAVFRDRIVADFRSHDRAPGFLTIVAGTCVLGTHATTAAGIGWPGFALWSLGLALWLGLMYTFFLVVCVRSQKPSIATGINGAWLLAAVATQSTAVLGASLHPGSAPELVALLCVGMFLLGALLYLSIIPLIMYRLTFLPLSPAELTPPYWINMGAAAITTLAGSLLILRAEMWPLVGEMRGFLVGFTLFFWVAGSWWVPLLLILGIWRHINQHYPLRYSPQFWAMVFPLAMYASATYQLGEALQLDLLIGISAVFTAVAGIAWLGVSAGLAHAVAGTVRSARASAS